MLLFLCTMIFSPCCSIPFNKAVYCLPDLQNKGVMRIDKLNIPEETTSGRAKVSNIRNEMALFWKPKEKLFAVDMQAVDQRRKLHLHNPTGRT